MQTERQQSGDFRGFVCCDKGVGLILLDKRDASEQCLPDRFLRTGET